MWWASGLLLLVAFLAGTPPSAPGARFDPERLPYRIAWGPYIVAVERIKGGDVPWERLRILDKQGRVVREIRDSRIFAVEFHELTGRPPKELYVSSFDGETRYCCNTDYFFSRHQGCEICSCLVCSGAWRQLPI